MSETHGNITDGNDVDLSATPTIVIGIGDRGIENARAIGRRARREGVEDRVLQIWINSRSEFPDHDATNVRTFHLKKPEKQHIFRDLQSRSYVSKQTDIHDASGAKRWREVARYLFDSPQNLERLSELLRTRISRFLTEFLNRQGDGPDVANVILTAAGGGGTGSGGLPLVSAMVDNITREMSAEGPLSSIAFHQWAIVSVATVQNTERKGVVPDIKPRFLSNTAMLLSELRAMAGKGEASLPLEIPLVATEEGAQMQRDSYTIRENPFDGIYLNRFVENGSQDIDGDAAGINHTAASVAFRWMRQDKESGTSAENIVENLDYTFFETRAVTFQAPTDTISELFSKRKRRDRIQASLERLESKQSEIETAAGQVAAIETLANDDSLSFDDLLSTDIDTGELQTDGGVAKPARRTRKLSLKSANNVTASEVSDDLIDNRVETLQLQLAEQFHDRIPAEELVAVVALKAVVERLTDTRESHDFPAAVRTFVHDNIDALESFNGAFDQAAPATVQYSEVVRPFLKSRIDEKRTELDQTTPIIDHGERAELKSQINSLETQLNKLDRLASEFKRIVETLESATERLTNQQAELNSALEELEQSHSRVTGKIEGKESQLEQVESRFDQLRTKLTNPMMGRTVTLPVVDPDRIDPEVFDESPGLSELIAEGIIDQSAAAAHIISALRTGEGSKPLKPRLMTESGERSPPRGRPIVLSASPTLKQLWAGTADGDKVTDVATAEFPLNHMRITQASDSELTVIAEWGNLHFENFIHPIGQEALSDTKTEIAGLDVDLRDSLAYPELLDHQPEN